WQWAVARISAEMISAASSGGVPVAEVQHEVLLPFELEQADSGGAFHDAATWAVQVLERLHRYQRLHSPPNHQRPPRHAAIMPDSAGSGTRAERPWKRRAQARMIVRTRPVTPGTQEGAM